MRILSAAFATLLIAGSAWAQPGQYREITHNEKQIIQLSCKVNFSTHIVLPPGEKILEIIIGNKDAWHVDGNDNHVYIKPAAKGIETNATVVTDANVAYELHLTEVSNRKNGFDQRVQVKRSDSGPFASGIRKTVDPYNLNFGYDVEYSTWFSRPLKVIQIYDDGRFTYLKADEVRETPAIFVEKDGERVAVNYKYQKGTYVIDRVFEKAVLIIGESEIRISRQNGSPKANAGT